MQGCSTRSTVATAMLVMVLGGRIPRARAITRGSDDDNSLEADAVVQLLDSHAGPTQQLCTGTLISPTAVLTAKHCVTGSDSSLGNMPAAQLPFRIGLGNPVVAGAAPLLSIAVSLYYGNTEPVNSQETGADLAIVWLGQPVLTAARIVRPDLRSPVPANGDDGEGGEYDVPIGVAGWSPNSDHNPAIRQVAYYGDGVYHYSGYPDGGPGTPSGQFWVHAQGDGNLEPGDSGGPLFWGQPDGARQVLGVADLIGVRPLAIDGFDCTFNKCDFWTDVTRDATAKWIRDQMEDRGRSVTWLDAHRRSYSWDSDGTFHPDYWKGEVDYTGPCNPVVDSDCDHWFDTNDNCPSTPNVDQRDSDDDGIGDACPPPPPPPPAAWCTAQWECDGYYQGDTVISCPLGLGDLTLQRLIDGTFQTISANTTQDLNAFVDYYDPPPGTVITYRVLRSDANGSTPSGPLAVVATDCSCHPDTSCGEDAECGTLPNGCGGTVSCGTCGSGLTCSENHCCPAGQSWDGMRNICTTRPKTCPPGEGDCGGYCCRCTAHTCG